jgi:succinyl-diaminopimelate desuccinylase
MSSPTLELAQALIRRPSLTPEDAGCQAIMAERLSACGFSIETMQFSKVTNLWARRGESGPVLAFAGHTDVVPTGSLDAWQSPPFEPEIRDGMLYGRGAADMKGSLAAMITAVEAFVAAHPAHKGSIAFLITSDEEGPATDGTVRVIETLQNRGENIDWCIVGEPSSTAKVGDIIKNGRRGSLSGELRIRGVQGHVAYPQLADNPVHRLAPVLAELCAIEWDQGDAFFPPSSMQITQLSTPPGAENVIPGDAGCSFNLRYCPAQTADGIKQRIRDLLDAHGLQYELLWRHSGAPFITQPGVLLDAVSSAVQAVTGLTTEASTAGGTSDGRFIAPTGTEVVELGPVNASIHQINEHVSVADLDDLSRIYQGVLKNLLL